MQNIKEILIERDGEEEAKAELEMAFENMEYDMETMSFSDAVIRALDDVYLEHDYADSMAALFDQWEAIKANSEKPKDK